MSESLPRTDYLAELEAEERPDSIGQLVRGQSLSHVERRHRVLKLRRQGFTYEQIAAIVSGGEDGEEAQSLTHTGASRIVRAYVEELLTEDAESAEVLRQIDTERLEGMFRRLELDAQSTDPQVRARAIGQQLRVIERHAKLHGLDAPTRVDVSGDVSHHLVADSDRVKEVDRSFARRHGKAIQLPAGGAREVK